MITEYEKIDSLFYHILIHGITHALGFTQNQLQYFYDENLNFYRPDVTGTYDGESISALASPKVLVIGKQYFACHDLPYVPLENNQDPGISNPHWESRVLHHETMTDYLLNDYHIMSNFTLAFFEDSGLYEVNHTYADNFIGAQTINKLQWGRGLGCDFVLKTCHNATSYPYLCDRSIRNQCTFDRLSRMFYPIQGICDDYKYSDGCPVVLADDSTSCIHEANEPVPNYHNEVYGESSICVEVNETTPSNPDCLPRMGTPQCHPRQLLQERESEELAFNISINGVAHWCRDSEIIQSSEGLLFCPSMEEILLRISKDDAIVIDEIPVSGTIYAYNKTEHLHENNTTEVVLSPCTPFLEDCKYGSVRLIGSSNQNEGTVQVCKNGDWGTICHYGWDFREAQVVCNQLGYDSQDASAFSSAHFGAGSGEILLANINCHGHESNILECSYSSPSGYCSDHSEDAGVRCSGTTSTPTTATAVCTFGDVRLVNGYSELEGRVEVCYNNQWGTVCDDFWDTNDANVVCRQLGNADYGATAYSNAYFGRTTGEIFLDNLLCNGSELRLIDCEHNNIGVHNCVHAEDAGVRCLDYATATTSTTLTTPSTPTTFTPIATSTPTTLSPITTSTTTTNICTYGDIRLVDGSSIVEGRVEMCFNDQWGTVCDDSWSSIDANVACQQLGYTRYGAVAYSDSYFGQGTGLILLDDLNCNGHEERLSDCEHSGLGVHDCSHYEDAGVQCLATTVTSPDFAVVTVWMQYIEIMLDEVMELHEGFLLSYCYESANYCDYIDPLNNIFGVGIQIVDVELMANTLGVSFFVNTPDGILTASSVQSAVEEAAIPGGILSMYGVTVIRVETPSIPPGENSNKQLTSIGMIAGVVVGVLVMLLAVLMLSTYICCRLKRKRVISNPSTQAPEQIIVGTTYTHMYMMSPQSQPTPAPKSTAESAMGVVIPNACATANVEAEHAKQATPGIATHENLQQDSGTDDKTGAEAKKEVVEEEKVEIKYY